MTQSRIPDIPIPPALKWLGGVAALLTAIIAVWVTLGGAVPLTKDSDVLKEMVQFERIQELEIYGIEQNQSHYRDEQVFNYLERDRLELMKLQAKQRPTDLDRKIMVHLETQILKYMTELEAVE